MTPIVIRVKEARQAAGLTQAELAKKARISQAAVSELEAGKTVRLNLDVLERLCTVLELEPGELLGREGKLRPRK